MPGQITVTDIPPSSGWSVAYTIQAEPGSILPAAPKKKTRKIAAIKWTAEEKRMKAINSFLVGCDPEFVILDSGGNIVNTSMGDEPLPKDGIIGYDHSGTVVEVRPEPCRGTYTLLKRIRELLNSSTLDPWRKHTWKAGAWCATPARNLPLGGHVHLDILPPEADGDVPYMLRERRQALETLNASITLVREEIEFEEGKARTALRRRLTTYMKQRTGTQEAMKKLYKTQREVTPVKALDAVMRRLEALDILPQKEGKARRSQGNYGKYGSFRNSKKGTSNEDHLEYRTFPSWLTSPEIAFIVLTLSKIAACEPAYTREALMGDEGFKRLVKLVEDIAPKDDNTQRLLDNVLSKGHKALVVDPTGDFKGRWKSRLSF